jgi:hypothetical protein
MDVIHVSKSANMRINPAFISLQGSSEVVLPQAANAPHLAFLEKRPNPYRVAREKRQARIAEIQQQVRLQKDSVKIGLCTIVLGAASVFAVTHFLSTPGIAGISLGMAGAALTAASLIKKSMLEQERARLEAELR